MKSRACLISIQLTTANLVKSLKLSTRDFIFLIIPKLLIWRPICLSLFAFAVFRESVRSPSWLYLNMFLKCRAFSKILSNKYYDISWSYNARQNIWNKVHQADLNKIRKLWCLLVRNFRPNSQSSISGREDWVPGCVNNQFWKFSDI